METIVLLLIFGILVAMLIVIFSFFIFKNQKNNKKETIFFCLELDTKRWIIKKNNSLLNNVIYDNKFNSYFKHRIGKGWIDINKLFDILNEKDVIKWKKTIEYCIQNEVNSSIEHEIKFKHIEKKKTISYYFNIKFLYINENRINIELRSKEKFDNKYLLERIIAKNQLFEDKHKYKLFIAFYIEDDSSDIFVSFIKEINKIINIKNVSFFKSNSIIVMFISNDSYKKLTKIKIHIQNKLINSRAKSNINNFYVGCAFVECENMINESNFSKIMTRISFSLVKSRTSNEIIHFNLNNITFNEFEEFKERIMNIHNVIEMNNFNYDEIPVLSLKNKRKVFSLCLPTLPTDDYYWNEYIIKMNEFDKKFREKFTNNILSNYEPSSNKKIILNINDYQIENIFEKMKNRKDIIFIVNQVKYKNVIDFVNLLKLLELSEIQYGLSFDEINSSVISIIANIKPKLIVLSEKFNVNFDHENINNKLRLVNSIVITERLGIILLFVNLTPDEKKEVTILSKKEKLFVNVPSNNFL